MNKPQIWAHRGACAYKPENTLESFQEAVNLHADGIELDIQMTKDGKIVVIHDETIDRTSDGTGWVKDFTYEELLKYNFNNNHPEVAFARIPLMEEVFDLIFPTALIINIELKTGIVFYEGIEEAILKMTKEKNMEDRVIYSSFNHYSVKKIQKLNPDARTAFLYADGPIDMPEYAHSHHVDAIHPALYNIQFPDVVEKAHQLGMEVNVWTVNEKEHIQLCMLKQVDAIITNKPDYVRKIIEEVL
ncbi:MAG: glycerophosphodiester phosphodiesterase [Solobacterium sp.]|nr:glycerophosphodiester phosphodiesterase [Solobacterium sp.]